MMMRRLLCSTAVLIFAVSTARAGVGELRENYQGVRALGMGGAFTALADDEQAIFYNPAGMAGITSSTFHVANCDLGLAPSFFVNAAESVTALKSLSGDSLNFLLGNDFYSRGQCTSSFTFPMFGIAYLYDAQAAFFGSNRSLPRLTLGYQFTSGVQAAFGFALGGKRKSKSELRLGIAVKSMVRRGGYKQVEIARLLNVSKSLLSEVTGNPGSGMGADLGSQYIHKVSSRLTGSLGLVYTDIGDTSFGADPDPIVSNLSAGAALQFNPEGLFGANIAYDYRHILDVTDWRKKNHLGIEFRMPLVRVWAGINQIYYSAGASLDLWLIRFAAITTAEELGSFARQHPLRKNILKIDVKFNL